MHLSRRGERSDVSSRCFLPLAAATGFTTMLTAPMEVLYARELGYGPLLLGAFMLAASLGVIVVDLLGTRFVPALDARTCLAVSIAGFGIACVGLAVATTGAAMLPARVLQGFVSGFMLGGALQAAVRVRQRGSDPAAALARFNAAFLFGGATGAPVGLLVTGAVDSLAGYRWVLVATGGLALVISLLTRLLLPSLSAPDGLGRPRIGLPRLGRADGSGPALVLAMVGDFVRGGVLFTALPLAGAARGFDTLTIGVAIAAMSAVEIVWLLAAPWILTRVGLLPVLLGSIVIGGGCAVMLALNGTAGAYLAVAALFGVTLAGLTAGLPLVAVGMTGNSATGLARFRISAGLGMLIGSTGCAGAATAFGVTPLFLLVGAVLALSLVPLHSLASRFPGTGPAPGPAPGPA